MTAGLNTTFANPAGVRPAPRPSRAAAAPVLPTALEFACVYPAQTPAGFAARFEFLSASDRIAAFAGACRVRSSFLKFGNRPMLDPLTFIALKAWARP